MSQNYDYLVNQGYQLYTQRDYQRSLDMYNQLIKIKPSEYSFYHMIGLCYYEMGKHPESLPYFDEAIRLNPNYEDSHYMKGSVLYARGDYVKADTCYDRAIEIKANHYLSYYQKGQIQYYYYQNRAEALRLYDKAILINNQYGPAYTQKGLSLYNLDRAKDALDVLNTATNLNPNDFQANYHMALCYYKLEDFNKAIPYLENSQRLSPNDYSSYTTLGLCQMALGRLDQALNNYLISARLNPSYSDVFINIGIIYHRKGNYVDAVTYYDKAIQMNPSYNLAYNNKATSLQMQGKYEEAIKVYDMSIEKNPHYPLSYCNRAKCKQALGRDGEALDDLNVAFKLFNNKEGIKDLQSSSIQYIQNILDHDRQELMHKIQEINQDLNHLESFENPELKAKAEVLRGNFSKNLGKTINMITDESQQTSKDDYKDLLKQMKEMQEEIRKLKEDMKDSGASEKAQIKRQFDAFEKDDVNLYDYCKTFYWTLFNYIGAYRALSTGMFQSNDTFDESEKDSVISSGLGKIASYAGQIAAGIPVAGGIIAGIDRVIGELYGAYNKRNMQNKINVITSLVVEKSISEDDLSIKIAKTAISVTQTKANAILALVGREPPSGKEAKLEAAVKNVITSATNKLKEVKDTYDTEAKKLALKDVTVLLAYLYKNIDKLPRGFALDEQLKSIVVYGGYDSIVEGGFEAPETEEKKSKAEPEANSGACKISCSIF